MAELFLAFTSGPGGFRKFVALKQILPDVKTDEFVKMFLDEARITAAFSHPNIGQVFDLGLEDEELYLAMEFLPGQNLEQVMIAASYVRPLPVGFAARVARDVCLGLHYAHNFTAPSGRKVAVVHRDMAPRNVMITYDGVVKVIDFGIAKARGRIARTHVGMVKGTSGYMSPEQVRGQDLDGRSDLFTAGVLLHEMLCGQRLFDTNDEDKMMRQIANADIVPPRVSDPDVPEALDAVVMKALAKDPAKRFATGREMAKAIEAAMGTELFDEESVAELMQALFAEKRLKTLALLDYASHDDERVSQVVEALKEDEKTLNGFPVDPDDIDLGPTAIRKDLPAPEQAPRPAAPRPSTPGARAPVRKQSSTGEQQATNPPSPRPFPAPPRALSSASARAKQVASVDQDSPTQIGPAPGMPAPGRSATAEPEARESRRPPKMGVFTLGPSEPRASPPPNSRDEDSEISEVSEVSRVSRVSRALQGLDGRSRRGLWIVAAILAVGVIVLLLPESVKGRVEALFSSKPWTSEPQAGPGPAAATPEPSTAKPSQEAYEPPPPAEGGEPQAAEEKPSHATEAERPKKPGPSAASIHVPKMSAEPVAKPTEEAAEEPSQAPEDSPEQEATAPAQPPKPEKAPAIQAKPEGRTPKQPAEEAAEPEEPSVGPAEVDPSIKPLELSPPTTPEPQ
ncbi:MAG: protein kinase domain-containing protein [Hyalangium sp.]|uniref:serine/threonine-protein kinase n=1 Tax=Hyalangium sp. TaxID=2028555 RepID=UPI00389A6799